MNPWLKSVGGNAMVTLQHVSSNWKIYLPTVLAIGGVVQSIYHCFDPSFCEAVIGIAAALGIYSRGHKPGRAN